MPERTRAIEIACFVKRGSIHPTHFDRPYYLEPQPKSEKAYVLLREALRSTGAVGVARVVLRTREHVAAVLVERNVIILNLLRYAYELRDASDLKIPGEEIKGIEERELQLAHRLVEEMLEPWDPRKYRDEFREKVLALARKRARSVGAVELEEPPEKPARPAAPVDLMSLLKRSVDEAAARPRRRAKTA
jgi:DNA end-binding protein Ku